MKKLRRNNWQIYSQLLTTALVPTKKTALMYRNNLSYVALMQYLAELTDLGLIRICSVNPHTQFVTTEDGKEWLRRFNALETFHMTLKRR